MFKHGFVFGKYYPLHNGHLALIQYAISLCNQLTVIVCASSKELITSEVRASWIREEFSAYTNINVVAFDYDEAYLPNTSVSDWDVSKVWAEVFKKLVPSADLVVTSEPYGDFVAQQMDITHVPCRQARITSSTLIRRNRIEQWEFLPRSVKKHLQKIVVISGSESTGKTLLAEKLSAIYSAPLVEEAGRRIISNSNQFLNEDLYLVAEEHARQIDLKRSSLMPLIIVDTDVYVTQSYSHFTFGEYLDLKPEIYKSNLADLRFLLSTDVPYAQDGTRMSRDDRNALALSHQATLDKFEQSYQLIEGGNWDFRLAQVKDQIDSTIFGDHAMK